MMSEVQALAAVKEPVRLEREETEGNGTNTTEVVVGSSKPMQNLNIFGEEEELCGVCLEKPEPGAYVELWCCGNVLCVNDAQQLGKCPFCREEPLVWNILK